MPAAEALGVVLPAAAGDGAADVVRLAKRFACSQRHVYRLVDGGLLASPTLLGSRNYWRESDVEAAELRRKLPRRPPKTRAPQRSRDVLELTRAFWDCWRACGLRLAVELVQNEGVEHPDQVPVGAHARLAHDLRTAVALKRRRL